MASLGISSHPSRSEERRGGGGAAATDRLCRPAMGTIVSGAAAGRWSVHGPLTLRRRRGTPPPPGSPLPGVRGLGSARNTVHLRNAGRKTRLFSGELGVGGVGQTGLVAAFKRPPSCFWEERFSVRTAVYRIWPITVGHGTSQRVVSDLNLHFLERPFHFRNKNKNNVNKVQVTSMNPT